MQERNQWAGPRHNQQHIIYEQLGAPVLLYRHAPSYEAPDCHRHPYKSSPTTTITSVAPWGRTPHTAPNYDSTQCVLDARFVHDYFTKCNRAKVRWYHELPYQYGRTWDKLVQKKTQEKINQWREYKRRRRLERQKQLQQEQADKQLGIWVSRGEAMYRERMEREKCNNANEEDTDKKAATRMMIGEDQVTQVLESTSGTSGGNLQKEHDGREISRDTTTQTDQQLRQQPTEVSTSFPIAVTTDPTKQKNCGNHDNNNHTEKIPLRRPKFFKDTLPQTLPPPSNFLTASASTALRSHIFNNPCPHRRRKRRRRRRKRSSSYSSTTTTSSSSSSSSSASNSSSSLSSATTTSSTTTNTNDSDQNTTTTNNNGNNKYNNHHDNDDMDSIASSSSGSGAEYRTRFHKQRRIMYDSTPYIVGITRAIHNSNAGNHDETNINRAGVVLRPFQIRVSKKYASERQTNMTLEYNMAPFGMDCFKYGLSSTGTDGTAAAAAAAAAQESQTSRSSTALNERIENNEKTKGNDNDGEWIDGDDDDDDKFTNGKESTSNGDDKDGAVETKSSNMYDRKQEKEYDELHGTLPSGKEKKVDENMTAREMGANKKESITMNHDTQPLSSDVDKTVTNQHEMKEVWKRAEQLRERQQQNWMGGFDDDPSNYCNSLVCFACFCPCCSNKNRNRTSTVKEKEGVLRNKNGLDGMQNKRARVSNSSSLSSRGDGCSSNSVNSDSSGSDSGSSSVSSTDSISDTDKASSSCVNRGDRTSSASIGTGRKALEVKKISSDDNSNEVVANKTASSIKNHHLDKSGRKENERITPHHNHPGRKSWCLLHPTGECLSRVCVSNILLPNGAGNAAPLRRLSNTQFIRRLTREKRRGELDVGGRVMQIIRCGGRELSGRNEDETINYDGQNGRAYFVARTPSHSSVFSCKALAIKTDNAEKTRTKRRGLPSKGDAATQMDDDVTNLSTTNQNSQNEDKFAQSRCSGSFSLQEVARVDLRSSDGRRSYTPKHITSNPNLGNAYTDPAFAILSYSKTERNVIHHVTIRDPLPVRKHKIPCLKSIAQIEASIDHPLILWASATSYVRPALTQGFMNRRPVLGHGHSLYSIDLRTNTAVFQWSPSHEEYMTEGLHSITGIMPDVHRQHSVWVNSATAGKMWEIDTRMPCRTLNSWSLPSACDDWGAANTPAGLCGSGILLTQPVVPYARSNMSHADPCGPVLGIGKSPASSYGLNLYQRPVFRPRFQTRNLECTACPDDLPSHGTSIARSSMFTLPDVSETNFVCGLAAFRTSVSEFLMPDLVKVFGYENQPQDALCVMSMTQRGDIYAQTLLECSALEKRRGRCFEDLPVGSTALPLPQDALGRTRHHGTKQYRSSKTKPKQEGGWNMKLNLSDIYPLPSAAVLPDTVKSKRECRPFKTISLEHIPTYWEISTDALPDENRTKYEEHMNLLKETFNVDDSVSEFPKTSHELKGNIKSQGLTTLRIGTTKHCAHAISPFLTKQEDDVSVSCKEGQQKSTLETIIDHPSGDLGLGSIFLPHHIPANSTQEAVAGDAQRQLAHSALRIPTCHAEVAYKGRSALTGGAGDMKSVIEKRKVFDVKVGSSTEDDSSNDGFTSDSTIEAPANEHVGTKSDLTQDNIATMERLWEDGDKVKNESNVSASEGISVNSSLDSEDE